MIAFINYNKRIKYTYRGCIYNGNSCKYATYTRVLLIKMHILYHSRECLYFVEFLCVRFQHSHMRTRAVVCLQCHPYSGSMECRLWIRQRHVIVSHAKYHNMQLSAWLLKLMVIFNQMVILILNFNMHPLFKWYMFSNYDIITCKTKFNIKPMIS